MKIFLSHSSADKDIVGRVYNELGPGICHYDVATFDPTGFLPEEIFTALGESTHFVFFASATALSSPWVQGELKNLFINWMRSKTTSVMVFLMRGGDRRQVPEWLQNYVITEHPSPMHIACRILSEYDRWYQDEDSTPPFYRSNESKFIEKQLVVESARMPACLLISGTDGSGRKELLNHVFSRLFRNIPPRKILLYSENFDTDVDLYKSLLGVFSLTTPRELAAAISEYASLSPDRRLDRIVSLIKDICGTSQSIVVDAADSIFTDSGEINHWLQALIEKLPNDRHPLLSITTNRKPSYINQSLNEKVVSCHLEPLQGDDSALLFKWWLNNLSISLPTHVSELVLEQVSGNPKLIATAAKLLKNVADPSDIRLINNKVFSDLEKSASKLFFSTASDDLSKLILALVVDCGHIAQSDLLPIVATATGEQLTRVTERYSSLLSYGLLQADSMCVKAPAFLARLAKSFGRSDPLSKQLSACWRSLANSVAALTWDDEVSISLLNDACILSLKSGVNSIIGIESLVLPSQCLRIARQLYDSNEYFRAYELCVKAFQSRLALTDDGAIEALRYRGMSAARLNAEDKLTDTLKSFSEYSTNVRAKRISEFIRGFDFRLAGKFDRALEHMLVALKYKGDQDIHVLRELAFLSLATNEHANAKLYINKAIGRARNNTFILELQILTELAFGKGYVLHHASEIEELIDGLDNITPHSRKSYAFRARVQYFLARGDTVEARELFDRPNGHVEHVSVVNKLLEAKLLLAERKYQVAYDLLVSLKKLVLNSKGHQRRSILPMTCDLLIQAAASVAFSTGLSEYSQNRNYLPTAIQKRTQEELREVAAYSKIVLSDDQRIVLGL